MKIWEILQNPQHQAIYKATNTVPSWEGVQIQVEVDYKGFSCVKFVSLPRIHSFKSISVGRTIPLVGAVTQADWEYIKTADVSDDFTIVLTEFARDLMYVIRIERNKHTKNKMIIGYFQELEQTISNVLVELERQRDEILRNQEVEKQKESLHQLKTLYFAVEKMPMLFLWDDVNRMIEHCEMTLSLIYSTFHHLWGEEYWNDNIRCHLTREEMLALASEQIEKTERE
jgi:hypothetical protein